MYENKMKTTEKLRIRKYLEANRGIPFNELGIQDESRGRYLRAGQIVNSFFIRHIKVYIASEMSTGEIGAFVYHGCKDLLATHGFWTTKRKRCAFWYSWA